MKMRTRCCPETSVRNYYYELHNNTEERDFAAEAWNHPRLSKSRNTVLWDTDCRLLPSSANGLFRFTERTQSKRVCIQVQLNLIPSSITTDLSTRDVPLFLLNQVMCSCTQPTWEFCHCQKTVIRLWQPAAVSQNFAFIKRHNATSLLEVVPVPSQRLSLAWI